MSTSFHFSLDVNIALAPALQSLLETALAAAPAKVQYDAPFEAEAEPTPEPEPTPAPVEEKPAKKEKKEKPFPTTPEKLFEEVKEMNSSVAKLEKRLGLELVTDKPAEFIRAAMADCRTRIEGEGYTKDSAYHKELTAEFKRIAQLLGSEKPSELPADKVESFVDAINNLYIDEKLELNTKLPF
jgi:hypothetical protein